MTRQFSHRDENWEVQLTGFSHGVGCGHLPPITSWGVEFKSLSNAAKGPYRGSIAKADLRQVSDRELQDSLDAAIAGA